jgi:PleD family two-component response regulator
VEVLVAEPSLPLSNALKKFLEGSANVRVARFLDEAVQLFQTEAPGVLVASVSGSFEGEVLCVRVKRQVPATSVVLVYPADEFQDAARRAEGVGADAFLVGPLKKHVVLSVVRSAFSLHLASARARKAEAELATAKAQLTDQQQRLESALAHQLRAGVKATDEAFFKKYMLLELKRSKRYRYPVSLLLVALDRLETHLAQASAPELLRATIRGEALQAISALVRDIDIAMPFGDDKYLVFLPHTPRDGARVVAERVVERVRRLSAFTSGTASVGVACFDPAHGDGKAQVSFAALVREAAEMLKKAFGLGGDRAEVPDAPQAAGKPKKSRIVMG